MEFLIHDFESHSNGHSFLRVCVSALSDDFHTVKFSYIVDDGAIVDGSHAPRFRMNMVNRALSRVNDSDFHFVVVII